MNQKFSLGELLADELDEVNEINAGIIDNKTKKLLQVKKKRKVKLIKGFKHYKRGRHKISKGVAKWTK